MKTTAVQDGDEWVINGTKNWISNLGVADFYICFAVTDRESRRITAFVVDADRPADLRGRPRAGRKRDRRGRQGALGGARDARAHAPRRGRPGRRHRPG